MSISVYQKLSIAIVLTPATSSQGLLTTASKKNGIYTYNFATVPFLADLIRNITLPLRLDFMGVSSYGNNTVPSELVFTKELKLEAKNRDVLLVDDILDTGKTLRAVMDKLDALQPRSLRTCVMLEKKSRRSENITADYVGFDVPDAFVVGYGLDYAEKYRNLPFIGVLKPEVYS